MVEFTFDVGKEEIQNKRFLAIFLLSIYVILLWALTIYASAANDLSNPMEFTVKYRQYADTANFFLQIFTLSIIAFAVSKATTIFAFAPIGTREQIFKGAIIGAIVAAIGIAAKIVFQPQSIVGIPDETVNFFYVKIAAPVVEETMFRGFMPYTLYLYTRNFLVALIVPNLLFGAFHYYIDIGVDSLSSFFSHFVAGIVATLLNLVTGTFFTGIVYHGINNVLVG